MDLVTDTERTPNDLISEAIDPLADKYRSRKTTEASGALTLTASAKRDTQPSKEDVALIVGGGPGISSSCARLFAKNGMCVGVAARNPDQIAPAEPGEDARRASIRVRCKRARGRGAAV